MFELAELVQRRLVELGDAGRPLSIRAAANKSRGQVSHETLRQLVRGEHSGNVSDKVVEGLSLALDLPSKVIYEAARVPRPQSRWQWPERFDRLDLPQRRLVEDVAAALLESYEKGLREA